ncbi:hypothetical protein B0H19DRAFT_1236376 [Mycena capillaripes]|nr:hypothetical protein B0H19DRAFT_1236376 [Mycena capillaripes]
MERSGASHRLKTRLISPTTMAHSKPQAATAPPGHARRMTAASSAKAKAERSTGGGRKLETSSTKQEDAGASGPAEEEKDKDAPISDCDSASGEGSAMESSSEPEPQSEAYRSETSRALTRRIHGIPEPGEDPEWDAFIADSDDSSEVEDAYGIAGSSDSAASGLE